MKFRIASLLALATVLVSAALAADAPPPKFNTVASIKVTASPGDSIMAAKSHHREYVYLTHAADGSVDVIDVSDPSSPQLASGKDAERALNVRPSAVMKFSEAGGNGSAGMLKAKQRKGPRVAPEFPNAISTAKDKRKFLYVLDEDSLRIFSTPAQQQQQEDDSWFWNAQTPG